MPLDAPYTFEAPGRTRRFLRLEGVGEMRAPGAGSPLRAQFGRLQHVNRLTFGQAPFQGARGGSEFDTVKEVRWHAI